MATAVNPYSNTPAPDEVPAGLVNSVAYQPAQANLSQWGVTPEQTVQGQVNTIIDQDGPLMQQARSNADQQSNARGLINSSMAVGAGQAAVMDKAIQIGAQDANTYASSAQANTASANNNAQFNANANNAWNTQALDRTQQMQMENTRNAANKDLKILEVNSSMDLAALKNSFDTQASSDAQFNEQYQMYTDAIYKIDMDKDLSPEAKVAMKNDQAAILKSYSNLRKLGLDLNFLPSGSSSVAPAPAPAAPSTAQPGDEVVNGVNVTEDIRQMRSTTNPMRWALEEVRIRARNGARLNIGYGNWR